MGNKSIYNEGTKRVYQAVQIGITKCLAGRPYLQDTRETQLSPFVQTLHIPIMCKAHASLCGKLSRETPARILLASLA